MSLSFKIARIEEMETRLQTEFGNAFDPRRNSPEAILLRNRIDELVEQLKPLIRLK